MGRIRNAVVWTARRTTAIVVAAVLTVATFLVLPLMQTIGEVARGDMLVRSVDTAVLQPPPPVEMEPPPEQEEEEPPEEPPELEPQAQPLDLAQLELALNPTGLGEGAFGDFAIELPSQIGGEAGGSAVDEIFSLADLDRQPRPLFQRPPTYPPELRKEGRHGTVTLVFLVDREGRVVDPRVERATDPAFERPALEAVRQWRFEPGTRRGEKVPFKMRIPITFNAG